MKGQPKSMDPKRQYRLKKKSIAGFVRENPPRWPKTVGEKLTFIDLFAGIGGTRIAFEKAGCRCVFSSEWNKFTQMTYEAKLNEKPR